MDFLQIALRVVQFLWTVILTSLFGNVLAISHHGIDRNSYVSRRGVKYSMFVACFAWIPVLYGLLAAAFAAASFPVVILVLDVLAFLLTFTDAIALAALLHVPDCGTTYYPHKCRELQAATAFMWLLFATFAASLVYAVFAYRRGGRPGRSRPTMSQVRV
ncbi:hypothetical protein SLS53_003365 [Cytospora paraplurivora]|uniref:MARVEL domain-containing protein n=1 Tax=Cytospora paraplurivora TaxID=2898453 RepID=A0AAN9UCM0_9PEZI